MLVLLTPGIAFGQSEQPADRLAAASVESATVFLDGHELLQVRGIKSYPATRRAQEIAARIAAFAADPEQDPELLYLEYEKDSVIIQAPGGLLAIVYDFDAEIYGLELSRELIANTALTRIREAVAAYRADRQPKVLLAKLAYALGFTLMMVVVFLVGRWGYRKFSRWIEGRIPEHLEAVEARSFRLVRADQLWNIVRGAVRVTGLIIFTILFYLYLNAVLGLFPWTRALSSNLLGFVIDPIRSIGNAVLAYLPDLVFLILIILIFRYVLKLLNGLFTAISRKRITLRGFEPEWAVPTYRLVRLLVLAFALVLAYPYIPGSDSAAFKGVSIFLGVLASIGSSSIISNVVAGYTMVYRRAFKVGDRVRIGDTLGDVTETRLLVTHVRTPKNEEVVIPNSVILNNEVINYSALAKTRGLILHTSVGIGYEVPWRQVEAMLLLAASRTKGIIASRDPFVLRKALGDFAITYELNVYVNSAANMVALYSALHDNILDVFNEYGVAIMTPSYEADPEEPKLVPRDQWYAAPAKPPLVGDV